VGDPISMQIAPDGKIWVLEMRGYMNGRRTAKGEDAAGGHAWRCWRTRTATVAWTSARCLRKGFVMPRAMSLVGDGVLVGGAADACGIMRDTNGDGVADRENGSREATTATTSNPEHNANGLGVDDGQLDLLGESHGAVSLRRRGEICAGRRRSRAGSGASRRTTRGGSSTTATATRCAYDAVPSAYLRRNPNVAGHGHQCAARWRARLATFPGRVTPGINRGYKTLDKEGKLMSVTAACGPVVYRGTTVSGGVSRRCVYRGAVGQSHQAHQTHGEATARCRGSNAYEGTEFLDVDGRAVSGR
jgi:hypothetical protein